MPTLLQINTSIFGTDGQSSQLTDRFVTQWQAAHPEGRVITRDFSRESVPHLSGEGFKGFQIDDADRSKAQRDTGELSDTLINELREADEVVIGLPMYNYGIPSQLKAWFDHVARAGVTFRYTANGPEGLLEDKPVTLMATRGGIYQGTEKDSQTRHVTDFLNLLGLHNIRFVYAEGLSMGDKGEQALADANEAIGRLAA